MPAGAAAESVSSGATIALLLGSVVSLWVGAQSAGAQLCIAAVLLCMPALQLQPARCRRVHQHAAALLPLVQVTLVGLWFVASMLLTRSLQRPSSGLRSSRRPSRQRLE